MLNSNRSVDWWPLTYATKNGVIPAGEVRLQIEFLPATEGVLVVTAFEGRNLKNMELIGKQDPYCKFTLGKKLKKRTRTVKKGGTNPFFNEEEVEFWIGSTDWGHPLVFSCLDEDVGSDVRKKKKEKKKEKNWMCALFNSVYCCLLLFNSVYCCVLL